MNNLDQLLEQYLEEASLHLDESFVEDVEIQARIKEIAECSSNRAAVRLIMSCVLAKIDQPNIDVRKPYTEIGTKDSFSGRVYDEKFIQPFIFRHELPCNPTTAFLTPALRNIGKVLVPEVEIIGKPRSVYKAALELLTDVKKERIAPKLVLLEVMRFLVIIKNDKSDRLESLLRDVRKANEILQLSAEGIITLISQHLACKYSSRLPVLVVAAAYKVSEKCLGEKILHLHSHNAADEQTGALGDLEITLINDDEVITSYEMKSRRVTKDDIDRAVQKVVGKKIDNYIFITTDIIEESVVEYAKTLYDKTGGIEFVILDCVGFLRHFLHLFHRVRSQFLEEYQAMLLIEPESAVGQPLKEAFLALRRAAQIQPE